MFLVLVRAMKAATNDYGGAKYWVRLFSNIRDLDSWIKRWMDGVISSSL